MKFKKLLAVVGSVVVAGSILAACSETTVEKKESGSKTEETASDSKSETTEDKTFKVGDTVSVNDVDITITKAEFTSPEQYTPAEKGKVLTLEVTAKNGSSEQQFVDNTDFAVYDENGVKVEDYYGYDQMAISDNINKGRQLNGKLYYDVPEQGSYELVYTPSFSWDGKEVKWNIEL
ncbi:DUF4352 domain-containing protein [Priestia aryabhattai]|uniref:DUF4352 domain-containing protein n=1 Tax=Priestia aryabhattai TaxID=412384 RepID=UPI002881D24D|nr:DUF4352 domain-containing protein [Priestia aryabhattai]MDT0150029.1 DUF4352 domain-containing protein [Priestia aryabhattai]MDT0155599.1 DUF4352 domain-containing protein [Priestia aryabhattai]